MNHADTGNWNPVVLVTGANSLLGTHVIERFLSAGYRVKGLLRDKNRFHLPPHPNLTLTEGDFTDTETVKEVLWGCEYIVHVAACTDQGVLEYDHYYKINVEATHQLFALGVRAAVKRFVYVSTANCFGFGNKDNPGNETRPACRPFTESLYARSKLEAQGLLLQLKHLMDVIIVNPTFMLGAYDARPSSGRIILMAHGRRVVFCPPGGKNFINASDAATGIIRALEHGSNGEAYILSGENLTYKEFYRKVSKVTCQRHRYLVLPKAVLIVIGLLGNLLQNLKIRNQFTLTNMKILCIGNYYTNLKAISKIGLETTVIEQGVADAIEWFKSRKMIKL
jgi:nucleoside-diphosphate-sugar epimerase